MKKTLVAISCLLVAVMTMFSCSEGETKLSIAVAAADKLMPQSMGMMGEMTSIDYEDNMVVFTCMVNEDIVPLDQLELNQAEAKNAMLLSFKNGDDNMKEMLGLMKDAKAGMMYKYVGKDSGDEVKIVLEADELTDLENNDELVYNPMEALQASIEAYEVSLPQDLGSGMVITKVNIFNSQMVYTVIVDNPQIVSGLNMNKDAAKQSLLEYLQSDDELLKAQVKLCKDAGVGISYDYVTSDGNNRCLVEISASEL